MKLDTKQRANSTKVRFLAFVFITVVIIALLFLTDYVKQREIPIGVIVLGLLVYIFYMIKNYTYIQYHDEGQKIVFRYFKLIPATLDHHAVEIPKQTFVGFEIKEVMGGIREDIILIQQTKNGIAKYPPISLSILNDTEKELIKKSLTKLSRR